MSVGLEEVQDWLGVPLEVTSTNDIHSLPEGTETGNVVVAVVDRGVAGGGI